VKPLFQIFAATICLGAAFAAPVGAQTAEQIRNDCASPDAQTRIRACSELIRGSNVTDVNMPVAYNNRGLAYSQAGESDSAIQDFNQAISLFPSYAIAYSNRGLVYEAQGQFDKALADFSQALKLNPNFAGAYNNRCYVLAELGRPQEAVADCQKALALTPDDPKTLDSLGFADIRLGDYSQAISSYNAALKTSPNMPESLYGRGIAKLKSGDQGGDADVKAAAALDPSVAGRMAKLGVVR